jgi:hypothetical protein
VWAPSDFAIVDIAQSHDWTKAIVEGWILDERGNRKIIYTAKGTFTCTYDVFNHPDGSTKPLARGSFTAKPLELTAHERMYLLKKFSDEESKQTA